MDSANSTHGRWSELPWRLWRALIPWVLLLELLVIAAAITEQEVVLAVFGMLVIVDMIYCEGHRRR